MNPRPWGGEGSSLKVVGFGHSRLILQRLLQVGNCLGAVVLRDVQPAKQAQSVRARTIQSQGLFEFPLSLPVRLSDAG